MGDDRIVAARNVSAHTRSAAIVDHGRGTYALGRIVLLPVAGAPTETDVKSAKILTSMPDARVKLGEVLQCIMLIGLGWTSLGSVLRKWRWTK